MDEADFRRLGLEEIAQDRRRGASELARRCLTILAEYARSCAATEASELADKLRTFAVAMQASRPSMAAMQNLIARWLLPLEEGTQAQPLELARAQAIGHAQAVIEQSQRAVIQASERAAGLIRPGQTIITHSLSSTVLSVFEVLADRAVRAVITESRPLREGITLAAHLSRLGISTEYITDAQIGIFAAQADLALVGADSVLRDGSAVNKAGTYLLALAARETGIPFYVCCESFKFTTRLAEEVTLEEMDAAELSVSPPTGVRLRNVYFDVTPARMITAIITEQGILQPDAIASYQPSSPGEKQGNLESPGVANNKGPMRDAAGQDGSGR